MAVNHAKKIESIQGLRAISFFMIFLSHAGVIRNDWGGLGVSVFIVLSGFLMYLSYCEKDMSLSFGTCINLIRKKIGRLYPLHLLMLVPAVSLEYLLIFLGKSDESTTEMLLRLIPNVLLIHTWFPVQGIYFGFNGVAWYLATYMFLLAAFPFLLNVMKRFYWNLSKAVAMILVSFLIPILASYILFIVNRNDLREWLLYVFPPLRACGFFAGMQFGFVFKHYRYEITKVISDIALIGAATLSVFAIAFVSQKNDYDGIESVFSETSILFFPLALLIVYVAASGKGIFCWLLERKILVYVGSISMYTFLIHQQVILYIHMVWANVISEEVNVYILSIIALAITWIATRIYMKVEYSFKGVNK